MCNNYLKKLSHFLNIFEDAAHSLLPSYSFQVTNLTSVNTAVDSLGSGVILNIIVCRYTRTKNSISANTVVKTLPESILSSSIVGYTPGRRTTSVTSVEKRSALHHIFKITEGFIQVSLFFHGG